MKTSGKEKDERWHSQESRSSTSRGNGSKTAPTSHIYNEDMKPRRGEEEKRRREAREKRSL